MAAYKDEERGTWYVSFYYEDWTGAKGAYGKLRLDGEVAVNLIVVKKGERFDEAGKIRI